MTKTRRLPLIAGNWKMHLTLAEAAALAKSVRTAACGQDGHILFPVEVALCPGFVALTVVGEVIRGSDLRLGAQNMHFEKQGAFTGETSAGQLKDAGCRYVILGHSERRRLFKEDDAFLRVKLQAALAADLTPIFCVGETLEEREDGRTLDVLKRQIGVLEGFAPAALAALVVAYEPVWAIGTGKTATPAQAQEAHAFLRGRLRSMFDEGLAESIRILYGGSVTADNAASLLSQADIDGALVGGASLKAEGFAKIAAAGGAA